MRVVVVRVHAGDVLRRDAPLAVHRVHFIQGWRRGSWVAGTHHSRTMTHTHWFCMSCPSIFNRMDGFASTQCSWREMREGREHAPRFLRRTLTVLAACRGEVAACKNWAHWLHVHMLCCVSLVTSTLFIFLTFDFFYVFYCVCICNVSTRSWYCVIAEFGCNWYSILILVYYPLSNKIGQTKWCLAKAQYVKNQIIDIKERTFPKKSRKEEEIPKMYVFLSKGVFPRFLL